MFKDKYESVFSGVYHNFQGFLFGNASSCFFLTELGGEVDFQTSVERAVTIAIVDSADTWIDGKVGAGINDSFDLLARQYVRPRLEMMVIGLHRRAKKIPAYYWQPRLFGQKPEKPQSIIIIRKPLLQKTLAGR